MHLHKRYNEAYTYVQIHKISCRHGKRNHKTVRDNAVKAHMHSPIQMQHRPTTGTPDMHSSQRSVTVSQSNNYSHHTNSKHRMGGLDRDPHLKAAAATGQVSKVCNRPRPPHRKAAVVGGQVGKRRYIHDKHP